MKIFLFLILLYVSYTSAKIDFSVEKQFVAFQKKYNKLYSSEEFAEKYETFKTNLGVIAKLNEKAKAQQSDVEFGVNAFADLTKYEFRRYYLNSKIAKPSADLPMAEKLSDEIISNTPSAFDWRTRGAVTPVKNQGMCGSCWSFSTTGNVEGQWFLKNQSLEGGSTIVGLSEQNLVDCDHECMEYDGEKSCDQGCDGGLQPNAYTYIIKNGGIDTEDSYPYKGEDGKCKFSSNDVGAKISNFTMIPQDEEQMAAYLASHGPLAIAADAEEWQFYIKGIFDLPCGKSLDHGILIVGYSAQKNIFGHLKPYWIIKNSWGADWGLQGYLYVYRGDNKCGVADFVSSSIV